MFNSRFVCHTDARDCYLAHIVQHRVIDYPHQHELYLMSNLMNISFVNLSNYNYFQTVDHLSNVFTNQYRLSFGLDCHFKLI